MINTKSDDHQSTRYSLYKSHVPRVSNSPLQTAMCIKVVVYLVSILCTDLTLTYLSVLWDLLWNGGSALCVGYFLIIFENLKSTSGMH